MVDCWRLSEREDVLERVVRLLEVFREDAEAELVFGLSLDRAGGAGEVGTGLLGIEGVVGEFDE